MAKQESEGIQGKTPTQYVLVELNVSHFATSGDAYNELLKKTKSYFENVNKSKGGKLSPNGIVQTSAKGPQFIIRFASKKSADRVLNKEDHFLEFDENSYPLKVSPCPSNLQEEFFPTDVASPGSNTGSSTSSLSSTTMSESCDVPGSSAKNIDFQEKPLCASSPINASQDKVTSRSSEEESLISLSTYDMVPEIKTKESNTDKGQADDSDAGMCASRNVPSSNDATSNEVEAISNDAASNDVVEENATENNSVLEMSSHELDILNRSIKVKNAPDNVSELHMLLETKSYGGGSILHASNSPSNQEYVVTFREHDVASRYIDKGHITFNHRVMKVVKPELSELRTDLSSPSDSSSEGSNENQNVIADDDTNNAEIDDLEDLEKSEKDDDVASTNASATGQQQIAVTDVISTLEKLKVEEQQGDGTEKEITNFVDPTMSEPEKLTAVATELSKDDSSNGGGDDHATRSEERLNNDGRTTGNAHPERGDRKDHGTDDDSGEKSFEEVKESSSTDPGLPVQDRKQESFKGVTSEDGFVNISECDVTEAGDGQNLSKQFDDTVEDKFEDCEDDVSVFHNSSGDNKHSRYEENKRELESSHQGTDDHLIDELANQMNNMALKSDSETSTIRSRTVSVTGIPSGAEESVEMYLESSRRGGGKIESFEYNKANGTALVIFEEENVAKRFLERAVITIQGNEVKLTEAPLPSENQAEPDSSQLDRTIVIDGVTDDEVVLMFLENRRRGGGPVDHKEFNRETGRLTVRFEDKEVAEKFLEHQEITILDKKYSISKPGNPEECDEDEDQDDRTIMVEGVDEKILESVLIILESKRRGGGTIEKHVHNEITGNLSVQFEEKEVARKLLEQGTITFQNNIFRIKKAVSQASQPVDMPVEEPIDEETLKLEEKLSRTIIVKGVLPEMKETVLVYLENRRRGGGDAEYCELDENTSMLSICFEDKTVAENFLRQSKISIMDKEYEITSSLLPPIEVEPQETPEEKEKRERTVQLQGIKAEVVEDTIAVLETPRKGGGPVENYDYDPSSEVLTVIFQQKNVAESMLEKQQLSIFGSQYPISPMPCKMKRVESSSDGASQPRAEEAEPHMNLTENEDQVKEDTDGNQTTPVKAPGARAKVPSTPVSSPTTSMVEIEVRNIPANMTRDVIVKIFESKRYVGKQVSVVDVKYDPKEMKAVISYEDSEFARELLRKEIVTFKDTTFYLVPYCSESKKATPDQSSSCGTVEEKAVQVTNIPSDTTRDTLLMVFENKKRHGGGTIRNIDYQTGSGKAIILFEDAGVAQGLIRKGTVTFKETTFQLAQFVDDRIVSSSSFISLDTVVVDDIPKEITKDALSMLFENKKRYGGGKIKNMNYQRDCGKAVITFEDSSVAQSFIKKESVMFKNANLLIKPFIENETNVSIPMEIDDNTNNPEQSIDWNPSVAPSTTFSFNTVKVKNIPKVVSKDMLVMYFEGRRSDGGELKLLQYSTEKGKAIIRYVDPKVAFNVSKRSHQLSGADLQISALELPLDDVEIYAVEVAGITPAITKDFIQLYFENTSRNGGGPIDDFYLDVDRGRAVITFARTETVRSVMRKCPHVLNGVPVKIDVCKPLPPPPLCLEELDVRRLLAKHLPPGVTLDSLRSYIERASMSPMAGWTSGNKPGMALLDFVREPDYMGIRRLVSSKPLSGHMISVRKVPLTRCIQVVNIPEAATEEYLRLYFENPRCGGSDVKDVKVLQDEGCAIITFHDHRVINSLTSRKHSVSGTPVEVQPYYPWLGLNLNAASPRVPPTVQLPYEHSVLEFVNKRPDLLKEIESKAEANNCKISWSKNPGDTLELKFIPSPNKKRPTKEWGMESTETVKSCLSEFKFVKVNILQNIWNDCKVKVSTFHAQNFKNKIDLYFDTKNCDIVYVGSQISIEEFGNHVENVKSDLLKRLQKVTERFIPKPHELALLYAGQLSDEVASKFKDVEITFKESEISMTGSTNDVTQAKIMIFEKINNIMSNEKDASVILIKLVQKGTTRSYISEQFQKKNVVASYVVKGNGIAVYAFQEDALNQACKLFWNNLIGTRDICLDESGKALLTCTKWKDFIKSLVDEYKSLEISTDVEQQIVSVAGTGDCFETVVSRIEGFVEKHSFVLRDMPMELGYVDLIIRCMTDRYEKIKSIVTKSGGKLEPRMDIVNAGFAITCSKLEADDVQRELEKLTHGVIPNDYEIDRPGIPNFLYSRQGENLLSAIKHKHKVSIQLDKVAAKQGGNTETKRCQVSIGKGVEIIVVHGDITRYNVDVIVNAANRDLDHAGGVARAIIEAGGYQIQKECSEHIKKHGQVLDGNVYISGPGTLSCKSIFHAVGPVWRDGHNEEDRMLAEAVRKSLVEADDRHYHTIAMPAISSAIFGYPIQEATEVIIQTIYSYFDATPKTWLKEVHLVDNDIKAIDCFEQNLKKYDKPQAHEREQQGHNRRHKEGARASGESMEATSFYGGAPASVQYGGALASVPRFSQVSAGVLRTAEGVTVRLIKGSICSQQVDVIVNTTGKDLVLTNGNVSKSILQAAGPEIQAECNTKKPTDFNHGDIVVTSSYKLRNCRSVYHGSCRSWDNSPGGNCEQSVRTFLQNIFKQASKDRMKSVAIPAIGTGNLKIPHNVVANIMFDEMDKFSKQQTSSSLKDVCFVVYDKDQPSISAFERKITELVMPKTGTTSDAQNRMSSFSNRTSSSSVNQVEFDYANKEFKIGSMTMTVKEGDITKEPADAIVNSTNSNFDMGGAVGKAIMKLGGDPLKQELSKAKLGKNKVCVTGAGNLPAKKIIHLVAGGSDGEWKAVIMSSLEEAEKYGCRNVVFPLLGTGNIGTSVAKMANIMVDAVSEFSDRNSNLRSLKTIVICIFQKHMVKEFLDAAANRGKPPMNLKDRAVGALSSLSNWVGTKIWESIPVGDGFSEGSNSNGNISRSSSGASPTTNKPRTPAHSSKIVLNIYALSQKSIDAAIKDIESDIDDFYQDKIMDSPKDKESIAKLTPEQIRRIENLKNDFQVMVTVEANTNVKRIRIRGPPNDVGSAVEHIRAIFLECIEDERKKVEAEIIAQQVQWEYQEAAGFEAYPAEINCIIEKAYQNRKPSAEWEEQDARYRIVFDSMEEIFVNKPNEKIKVRRTVNGEISKSNMCISQIKIIPNSWDPMANNETLKSVPLNPSDQEYKTVEANVMSSHGNTVNQIVKIERIQNITLYKQYVTRKTAMDNANPNVANERTLWHGTAADVVASINATGYNRSYCGKNATVFGRGVYFAKNFSYSAQQTYSPPDANGIKHIYQSKVLVGEFTLGNQAYIVPPPKASSTSATDKYDSVVDNVANPSVFVIFYDTQAYPEYLIYFK